MKCESCGESVTDREEKLAGGHLSWDGCLNALKARAEAAEAERDALRAQVDGDIFANINGTEYRMFAGEWRPAPPQGATQED